MKTVLAALFTTLLIMISCAATADVYKWTDAHGVVHYEDQQPAANDKVTPAAVETVVLKPVQPLEPISTTNADNQNPDDGSEGMFAQWLSKAIALKADLLQKYDQWSATTPVVTNETIVENKNTATEKKSAKPNNEVEIYTAAWCGVCKRAKRWLNEHNITYKEYDVEKDSRAAARMRKLGGGNSVPFAVINGKPLQGFNPNAYQAALRK